MNPLSTVIAMPFENNTLFNLGPSNSTANVLNIKPIFPENMGKWNLINRVTIPVVYTQGQDLESLDLERFDTERSPYINGGVIRDSGALALLLGWLI